MPFHKATTSDLLALPDSLLAKKVDEHVRSVSPLYLYNHSVRSFLFANALGEASKKKFDREVLFISCLMHDLGITAKYRGKTRFEVDGADAAHSFLIENGASNAVAQVVWDAIALHATPHIPLRKQAEISLVHIGTGIDVVGLNLDKIEPSLVQEILEAFPRQGLKKHLIKDLVDYLRQNPSGGHGYWMGDLARNHVPAAPCFDLEKMVTNAPFAD